MTSNLNEPDETEADAIAYGNADNHRLEADLDEDAAAGEDLAESHGRDESAEPPRMDPDPDDRRPASGETTPTRTTPDL